MGSTAGGGLGSCGVSRSLNGMYLVPSTGLSLKVTAVSAGVSEMKSTAVSCSELCGGPDRTEVSSLFIICFEHKLQSLPEDIKLHPHVIGLPVESWQL